MIGKITSEMISRRWALSLLGAFGFVAAPTVLRPSNAEAQTAGAAPGRRKVALALQGGGSHGAEWLKAEARFLIAPSIVPE